MEDRSAFDAAKERVAELSEKIASEKNKINDSQARLAGFERDLAEMERWLALWHRLTGTENPTAAEQIEISARPRSRRPKNPDRDHVANCALQIIRMRGEPMSRKDLFEALKEWEVNIQGKDPEMVLSTMLWRSQDKIVRLPQHGYWPKSEPWEPARYDPDIDDLIGAAAREPEGGELADDADD